MYGTGRRDADSLGRGSEWMINGKTTSMFTDPRETMVPGDQVSLLVPWNQTWPMCFRGDQSEFRPMRGRRWQHHTAWLREEAGLWQKKWAPVGIDKLSEFDQT